MAKPKKITKRHTTAAYQPKGLDPWISGEKNFTDEMIAAVIAAARSPVLDWVTVANTEAWEDHLHAEGNYPADKSLSGLQLLRHRLNGAAQLFAIQSEADSKPTRLTLSQDFRRVDEACSRLLAALGTPNGKLEDMPYALRYDEGFEQAAANDAVAGSKAGGFGAVALREAVSGVENLRRWARAAADVHANAPPRPTGSRTIDGQRVPETHEQLLVESLMRTWIDVFGRKDTSSKVFRGFVIKVAECIGAKMSDVAVRRREERGRLFLEPQ